MEQLTLYLKLHTGTLSVYLFIPLFSRQFSLLIKGLFAQMTTSSLISELYFGFWNPGPAPPSSFTAISHLCLETGSNNAGVRQSGPKTLVVLIEGGTDSGVYKQMGRGTVVLWGRTMTQPEAHHWVKQCDLGTSQGLCHLSKNHWVTSRRA